MFTKPLDLPLVYELQINQPTWSKTKQEYQTKINEVLVFFPVLFSLVSTFHKILKLKTLSYYHVGMTISNNETNEKIVIIIKCYKKSDQLSKKKIEMKEIIRIRFPFLPCEIILLFTSCLAVQLIPR